MGRAEYRPLYPMLRDTSSVNPPRIFPDGSSAGDNYHHPSLGNASHLSSWFPRALLLDKSPVDAHR